MANKSEEVTKGLIANKLSTMVGYSSEQDVKLNGVTWYKENSYEGSENQIIAEVFKNASKSQSATSKGTPDFIVVKENSNCIIVIECKAEDKNHGRYTNVKEYEVAGYSNNPEDTKKYAVDGALWYASFLNDKYDVIAIAASGQNKTNLKISSFIVPKGSQKNEIKLLEDCGYFDGLKSINDYENDIDIVLGRFNKEKEEVLKKLRIYTLQCANFLRVNGIEDNSKAGFVSAIILGLTNKESELYKLTTKALEDKRKNKSKVLLDDFLGKTAVKKT